MFTVIGTDIKKEVETDLLNYKFALFAHTCMVFLYEQYVK